ncbi:beta-galactosidase [Horticoccus luteus]|uniref:Beta-galactosidase n=1 Tax=Horticoccus luteus TaxID=2862869 RepID=A0A8F9TUD6_9BACT|nr:glycoside hydrolase family 35 protein [Horticoccus luteus]QYM79230.1 beta-galactosidase [Horticoccus luteus]
MTTHRPASRHRLIVQRDGFLRHGQPFQFRSGELHFSRVPRPYWRHRLRMMRAMGLNSVSPYLFWAVHEPQPGRFNFRGEADMAAFVRLAAQEGMNVILRPGPYVCAEWDFGGLPPWLLATPDIRVRCSDERYLTAMRRWLRRMGRELAPLQSTRGGPIILVQVENEYGSYGDDGAYLASVREALTEVGFDVPFFTCDGPDAVARGAVAGAFPVANFPLDPADAFAKLRAFSPATPLACGEFYPGTFDHWGESHNRVPISRSTEVVGWMLERKVSFSLYMAHGGTSFGFSAGANTGPAGEYQATVTSYDYDSPIDEGGGPTEKYRALRALIQAHTPERLPPVPGPVAPAIAVRRFALTESAALLEHLPRPVRDPQPRPMEAYGQAHGLILYRSRLAAGAAGRLTVREVHDYGHVYLDGRRVAVLDRRLGQNAVDVAARPAAVQLDILVEAMGRVNYGPHILDRKGITQWVEFPVPYPAGVVMNWEVFNLPLDRTQWRRLKWRAGQVAGPAFHRGSFTLRTTGDTYLDLRGWSKGYVWINGHNLGRFWRIGPQQTLYVPGCWLKRGRNEVIVLDLEREKRGSVAGRRTPVLGENERGEACEQWHP